MGQQASSRCPRACQEACRPGDWCNKEKSTVKIDQAAVAELNRKHSETEGAGKQNAEPKCCEYLTGIASVQDSVKGPPLQDNIVPEKTVHPHSAEKDQTPDETDPEDETQLVKEQPSKMKDCNGGVWASDEDAQLQEAIRTSLREQGIAQNGVQNDQNPQKSPQEQADLDALLAASLAYEEEEEEITANGNEKECHRTQIPETKMETTAADPFEDHERACVVQSFLGSHGFKYVNALIRKPIKKVRPLHVAVRKADSSLVASLIWSGADPSLKNGNGETPLELARKLNKGNTQKPVIAILEAAN